MDYHNDFILISEQLSRIADVINSLWPAISAIGTISLGAIAIFREQIQNIIFKPKLIPIEIVKTYQRTGMHNSIFQRLIIKNIGRRAAREVRVLLTYKNAPKNFIPVPLAWTHWQKSSRDISRGEPAYIDVLQKERETNENYDFCWPRENGKPYEKNLKEFNPDYGMLRLELFERDRKIGDFFLNFSKEKDLLEIKK